MRYIVIKTQEGEGCDYTIGCGMNYDFVDASNPAEAFQKIVEDESWHLDDEYVCKNLANIDNCNFESVLESLMIIPAPEINEHFYSALVEAAKIKYVELSTKNKEAKERAEYEKLKAKFEN